MKLQSTTDFCLKVLNGNPPYNATKMLTQISNYITFIKNPLNKGMFIPCDLDGNVLEEPNTDYEPIAFWNHGEIDEKHNDLIGEYESAKKRVLFEGFRYENNKILCWNDFQGIDFEELKTIEDLLKFYDIELTESAIKQFM